MAKGRLRKGRLRGREAGGEVAGKKAAAAGFSATLLLLLPLPPPAGQRLTGRAALRCRCDARCCCCRRPLSAAALHVPRLGGSPSSSSGGDSGCCRRRGGGSTSRAARPAELLPAFLSSLPFHRAGRAVPRRAPPRASGRAPSPRPLPAPDAHGHLFAAPARDSPVRGSPQRRPGGAGSLNPCAASRPGTAACAARGDGRLIPNGPGGSSARPRPRPRVHLAVWLRPQHAHLGVWPRVHLPVRPRPQSRSRSHLAPPSTSLGILDWGVSVGAMGLSLRWLVSKRD